MKRTRQIFIGIFLAVSMTLLILDSKTALTGAKDGILICLYTVIPSLFPFLILSNMINSLFLGRRIPVLGLLGHWLGIPEGGESFLLLGLLGGYPVGAQAIYDAHAKGQLTKSTAHRLLGFCNNSGPAFIFGMVSSLFTSPMTAWLIWAIHVLSALLVGFILPGKANTNCNMQVSKPVDISIALENGIRIMASICGWVIVFRIIIAFCQRWFLWALPQEAIVSIIGILELSNGCCDLSCLTSEGARFIISSALLAFGGICIGMQTLSVTKGLGTGMYFPGKILQSLLSTLFAIPVQSLLFSGTDNYTVSTLIYIGLLAATGMHIFLLRQKKKVVAICC